MVVIKDWHYMGATPSLLNASASTMRLAAQQDSFNQFGRLMAMDNKHRRQAEEDELANIKQNLERLERTLTNEVKHRVSSNRALQNAFEAQASTIQDKLESGVFEKIDRLHMSVDALNARVDNVEKIYLEARETYVQDIEDKSNMVKREISAVREALQHEWSERKSREILIIAKLKDLEGRTAERFTRDADQLDRMINELREELDVAMHNNEDKFQGYIFQEMASLKNGLVVETLAREEADDDIVKALNHYTQSVAEAMRIINTA